MIDAAAKIITRYAPIASVMNAFYSRLIAEDRATPFPVEDIRHISVTTGFTPLPTNTPFAQARAGW